MQANFYTKETQMRKPRRKTVQNFEDDGQRDL